MKLELKSSQIFGKKWTSKHERHLEPKIDLSREEMPPVHHGHNANYAKQRSTVKSCMGKKPTRSKNKHIRTTLDFSTGTLTSRKAWNDSCQNG